MKIFGINLISVLIAGTFTLPVLMGILRPFSKNRIQYSLISMVHNIELIVSIVSSVLLTNIIFTSSADSFPTKIFKSVPAIWHSIANQDIWAYALATIIMLFITKGILRLLMIPFFKHVVVPLSNRLSSFILAMHTVGRRTAGGIWQLPKSFVLVLIVSLLLNFYVHFAGNASLGETINQSSAYQFVDEHILNPVLSSSVIKKLPGVLNESVQKAVMNLSPNGRKQLIYFNGMSLDNAVKTSEDIERKARQISGSETEDKEKAYLLYKWISSNIEYDSPKAEHIFDDISEYDSGAITTFETGKGICFDIACLYAAMCRAVGVNVRFITGLAYGSSGWGSHSWNQILDLTGNRWLNVDATFGGSGGDYFDNDDFYLDHADEVIQGEW
ncbi:MAG: transglutaminase domain-containing protein [Clostridiales bacterium]|nr:transglutaminase domain-containing protein [Clostridiales bacterium]